MRDVSCRTGRDAAACQGGAHIAGENASQTLACLPDASCWPGISAQEGAYRESVLRDVRERIRCDGEHVARPHPDRARQFMPFSALKGYHEMAMARELVPGPRREMTEEHALALSQRIGTLKKGDLVRVVHYENSAYAETVGALSEVVEPYRMLRIVRKPIAFDDVWEVESMGEMGLDHAISKGLSDCKAGRVHRETATAKEELAHRLGGVSNTTIK